MVVLDLLIAKFDKTGGRNKAIEYDNFIEYVLVFSCNLWFKLTFISAIILYMFVLRNVRRSLTIFYVLYFVTRRCCLVVKVKHLSFA